MKKKKIESKNAPKAIGPYSQAISIGVNARLVFVSGQLPLDPQSGQLVDGDIKVVTQRVIDNLEAILIESGSSLDQVVRTDVFMTDLSQFAAMNEEYAKRFSSNVPPARQTFGVTALPKGASLEISCIAIANE